MRSLTFPLTRDDLILWRAYEAANARARRAYYWRRALTDAMGFCDLCGKATRGAQACRKCKDEVEA